MQDNSVFYPIYIILIKMLASAQASFTARWYFIQITTKNSISNCFSLVLINREGDNDGELLYAEESGAALEPA